MVIIAPWEFGKEGRGDILWRYTLPQVEWLKQEKYIPLDF
ncbi:Translation initiation factor 1A protein [Marine Group I thaumarchaeote SCGC AAA799-P11]|uniref:Translation initiation factor 1A protein n=1 Tax=Marine Group I thaumarchaeote SCGC AAA799-P11 TaxID=1502295 RepID=A0A087S1F8_9ARCH|nr:Translation initiation factor 1A protein [Marine Group I thaumarchaeote SCGC AAA799-P11]